MNIGQAAAASGVSAKMIRYYEEIGLLPKAGRTAANYRTYEEKHVHLLRFIRRARELGFPVAEVKRLLALWLDRRRPSAKVRQIAEKHLVDLKDKIAALQDLSKTLSHLIHCCRGDERPDCPILEEMAKV